MYDFLLHVIILNIIVVPLAFVAGYQLRRFVPQKRRLMIGFAVVLVLTTMTVILALEFQIHSRLLRSVQIAIAVGFPLGIAGPPLNGTKKKNI